MNLLKYENNDIAIAVATRPSGRKEGKDLQGKILPGQRRL